MIVYLSNRHSKEEKEVPANIWDLGELTIIQQIISYGGKNNEFHSWYGYLAYDSRVLCLGISFKTPHMADYSLDGFATDLFKESAPGTVLSFTQE